MERKKETKRIVSDSDSDSDGERRKRTRIATGRERRVRSIRKIRIERGRVENPLKVIDTVKRKRRNQK